VRERGGPARSGAAALAMAGLLAGLACGRTVLDAVEERGDLRPDASSHPDGSLHPDASHVADVCPHPDPFPPPGSSAPRPALARFAVIGDYGIDSEGEARVARMVARWDPDFVITTGDNNYPIGAADTIDTNIGKHYARFIGNYRGAFGPGSPFNRFWPSPGNHDWDTGTLAPYLDYFTLPGNGRYYDVVVGPVHLFAVDSDDREPDGNSEVSAQARWLEAALASSTSCFNVVYFHHPAYSSSMHGSSLAMRWPFEGWGATVVFAGHDHVYERFKVGGIRQVTVGVSGAELYTFGTPLPESEARFTGERGAVLATAREDGISFQFFADDGCEIDGFSVPKTCLQ